jgi:hypothetical protein
LSKDTKNISDQDPQKLLDFLTVMQDVSEQTFDPTKVMEMFSYEKDLLSTRNKDALGGKKKLQSALISANESMKSANPSQYAKLMSRMLNSSDSALEQFKAQIERDTSKGFFRPLLASLKLYGMREQALQPAGIAIGGWRREGDLVKLMGGLNADKSPKAVLANIELLASIDVPNRSKIIDKAVKQMPIDHEITKNPEFMEGLKKMSANPNFSKAAFAEVITKVFPEASKEILDKMNFTPAAQASFVKASAAISQSGKWGETMADLKAAVPALPLEPEQAQKVQASLEKIQPKKQVSF